MFLTVILVGIIIWLFLLNLVMMEWPSFRAVYISRKINGPPVIPLMGGIHVLLLTSREVWLLLINLIVIEWPSWRAAYIARKIHGPPVIPLLGGIHLLLSVTREGIMDKIQEYADRYPRIINFPVGGIIHMFIQEAEDVQVILGGTTHIQKGVEYLLIAPWLKEGLLTSTGAKWHSRRKLLTPTFHFRILEDSLNGINKYSDILVGKLTETKGNPIKIHQYVTKCTLDVIGDTAMGIDLDAQGESGKTYVECVSKVGASVVERILSVWQFKDLPFELSRNGKTFYKNLKLLHNFTDNVIKKRKISFDSQIFTNINQDDVGRKNRQPFLDCLLETQKSQPDSLTDQDIREEVDTFMFEGHDTTSAAISFALWLLGSHIEEQDKIYRELREIFGKEDRIVTMADTHKMVQMEKVIKETLRLYPSVPYISRRLIQDCVLDDGLVLPETTNAVIIPYLFHRNPRFFPEPEKFDPERFSEENSVGRHPFAYIPFSAGPRNCIGQKFAMLEMKVTLAKILLKLEVKSITRRDEFKILPYLIIRPTVPLKVTITPRIF